MRRAAFFVKNICEICYNREHNLRPFQRKGKLETGKENAFKTIS